MGVMIKELVRQSTFIHEIMGTYKESDPFIRKLLEISEAYTKETVRQEIHLCILRPDYMIDKGSDSLKLVEYNTIAAGLVCLSWKVRET